MNFTSKPSKKLMGIVTCPREKSISHRSVIMAASATGKTKIYGLLNGEDVIKNSLPKSKYTTPPFDKLKSSYRTKKKHK